MVGRAGKSAALALMAFGAVPAPAQDAPRRTVEVIVYGNDPCPDVTNSNEIVVCGRRPENDRYRIPKELRRRGERPLEAAWGSRVEGLEDAARAGRPNSCSPVGTYGQTGCSQQQIRDWYAARRSRR
jgi:hypothetical protein